jgi:hypothetical protein
VNPERLNVTEALIYGQDARGRQVEVPEEKKYEKTSKKATLNLSYNIKNNTIQKTKPESPRELTQTRPKNHSESLGRTFSKITGSDPMKPSKKSKLETTGAEMSRFRRRSTQLVKQPLPVLQQDTNKEHSPPLNSSEKKAKGALKPQGNCYFTQNNFYN